ncbi:MAG: hypothetical protein NT176_03755 [Proteobacteria bacterium]|nr:hypothetical protein [Pseudomonadota bacterium]
MPFTMGQAKARAAANHDFASMRVVHAVHDDRRRAGNHLEEVSLRHARDLGVDARQALVRVIQREDAVRGAPNGDALFFECALSYKPGTARGSAGDF